jgi:hypothetical protein
MHWPIQYVMNKHSFNIQQCKNKAYNTRAVGVHNLVGRTGKWYSTTNSNTQLYGHYFHNPYFFNLFFVNYFFNPYYLRFQRMLFLGTQ